MSRPDGLHARTLPATVSGALVAGWVGGAVAWAIANRWSDLSPQVASYARADQLMSLTLSACVGALVLVARARFRREALVPAMCAGMLLGGVGALVGCTLALFLPDGSTGQMFAVVRMLTWSLMAGFASVALAQYTRLHRIGVSIEVLLIGLCGGAVAGAMYSLPGPGELWWPAACTVCGAAIGLASVGPAMWRAPAVALILPPHEQHHTFWSLHERAIERGCAMRVASATISCDGPNVVVYPPATGAVLDGQPLYRPVQLTQNAELVAGRIRCRVTVFASS
ncbi:MAG: hypothetical protein ABJB74_00365 [Gemmatimonas sp.]